MTGVQRQSALRWIVVLAVAVCANAAILWTCTRSPERSEREQLVRLFERNRSDIDQRRFRSLWADMSPTLRESIAHPNNPEYADGYDDFYAFWKKSFYLGEYPGKPVEDRMPSTRGLEVVGEPRVVLRFPAAYVVVHTPSGDDCYMAYAHIGGRWWLDSDGVRCSAAEYGNPLPDMPTNNPLWRSKWE